ncbi:zinc finger protein [Nephila pilipes]|uniref:Zinc finger protein n=1 Tax=Nephila pilipes TaxID=299642 RepID=A0A8X6R4H9_NEPPI|nr:zinc finger protein [Nephila pilipes]
MYAFRILNDSTFDVNELVEEIPVNPINNFRCIFCKFVSFDKEDFTHHVNTHFHEKQPLKCPKCPKVFREKHHLQSHLYSHDTARHFKCLTCGRTFRHSSSLARHKRSHK